MTLAETLKHYSDELRGLVRPRQDLVKVPEEWLTPEARALNKQAQLTSKRRIILSIPRYSRPSLRNLTWLQIKRGTAFCCLIIDLGVVGIGISAGDFFTIILSMVFVLQAIIMLDYLAKTRQQRV